MATKDNRIRIKINNYTSSKYQVKKKQKYFLITVRKIDNFYFCPFLII